MRQAQIREASQTVVDLRATPRERFLAMAVLEAAVFQMYLADKESTAPSSTLHGPAFIRQPPTF